MTEQIVAVAAEQFVEFARKNLNRWQVLVNQAISHPKYGDGRVQEVALQADDIYLLITFNGSQEIKRFSGPKVIEIVERLLLPRRLGDQIHATLQSEQAGLTTGSRLNENQRSSHLPKPAFEKGQEVVVRANPEQRGVILFAPYWGKDNWEYEIFFGAQDKRIFRESDLDSPYAQVSWIRLDELLRNLALVKLRNPLSDNLYALRASRTEFEVYQFRPAVKFLGNPDQRLLIADEVGLGKTIEAGIIYLELQARLDLNRVLIVCPSGLRVKWQNEMKLRFDEDFDILDANGIRKFLDLYEQFGPTHRLRGITSLELLRRPEFTQRFEEILVHFDLTIIDEAHHCRNTGTRSNNLATSLSYNSDAMLLLTATPLQVGNEDLFNLLRILSPGEFDDLAVFLDRLEPNQYINQAAKILATGQHKNALVELKRVEETRQKQRFVGNPYYAEVVSALGERSLTSVQLVKAQRRLVELNTLANIFTRTRKREIGENVPTRSAHTIKVEFTPVEAQFYNRIIQYVREEFAALHGSNYVAGFVSIMRERQAASCISAARQHFTELAKETKLSADEQSYLDPSVVGEWDDQDLDRLYTNRGRGYQDVARRLNNGQVDTKFEKFLEALRYVLAEDDLSKIIVFSYFRHTIEYLTNQLNRLGIRVHCVHGGIKVSDRPAVIDDFRTNPEARVLISSEVGAEGHDFQFCNTIFNYDLPWNPMRVEQRIGRIDRFGQKSSKIRIYNLVIANSVEERILMRLYERIGLFERAIGDIEAILGEEVRDLSKKVYSLQLSPTQEDVLAEQAAQNIIRRRQEMEEFEKRRLQFMGQDTIFSTLVNQTIESGHYLSEVEVRSLVATFIRNRFKRAHLDINQTGGKTYALDVDHELAVYIRAYVQKNRRVDGAATDFMRKLDPAKELPVTFSSEVAQERSLIHFITARHPLAQAAAHYWDKEERIDSANNVAYFGVRSSFLRPGDYYFFLFLLSSSGAEQTVRLVPVAVVAENGDVYTALSQQLLHLIQTDSYDPAGPLPKLEQVELVRAEGNAKQYMSARRDEIEEEIKRSNQALVNARLTAVRQSYEVKRQRVERLLYEAKDQRIFRMRKGQLRNMEAEYKNKTDEIEKQRAISVSFSLVARGYLTVQGG